MHVRAVGQGMTKFGRQFRRGEESDHKVRRRKIYPHFPSSLFCMNKKILATDPTKTDDYFLLTFLCLFHSVLWL